MLSLSIPSFKLSSEFEICLCLLSMPPILGTVESRIVITYYCWCHIWCDTVIDFLFSRLFRMTLMVLLDPLSNKYFLYSSSLFVYSASSDVI